MIERHAHLKTVRSLLRENRVVAIVGARQVGKSTLAREIAAGHRGEVLYLDLEDDRDLARLADPMLALANRSGLVVLDEIQRAPDVFRALRVLADRPRGARFLVLGSASPHLLQQSSESLAGRLAVHTLGSFTLEEAGGQHLSRLWLRGGFPRSFVARGDAASFRWRRGFINTLLERDIGPLRFGVAPSTLARFWTMLAHYHAQIWNASELARSFGMADHTVRRYLDALAGTYLVRLLTPWHENLAKRQVKSPKLFVSDSGILHALLGINSERDLEVHPKLGASWEGFCVDNLIARLGAFPEECHFWATHAGAELDLLVIRGRQRRGFEIKRTSSPGVTASMRAALEDLRLDSLDVIYPGTESFPLADRVRAVPARRLFQDVEPLREA